MTKDANDPGTLDIFSGTAIKRSSPERKAQLNRERVKRHREQQKAMGRVKSINFLTDMEQHYLQRVLEEMRETGGTPAAMRDAQGKFYHLDT